MDGHIFKDLKNFNYTVPGSSLWHKHFKMFELDEIMIIIQVILYHILLYLLLLYFIFYIVIGFEKPFFFWKT